jgi:hypothetical protein
VLPTNLNRRYGKGTHTMNNTIDVQNLSTLEESITDLVGTIESIKQIANTHPDLVPSLLTAVGQALTGVATELHSFRPVGDA